MLPEVGEGNPAHRHQHLHYKESLTLTVILSFTAKVINLDCWVQGVERNHVGFPWCPSKIGSQGYEASDQRCPKRLECLAMLVGTLTHMCIEGMNGRRLGVLLMRPHFGILVGCMGCRGSGKDALRSVRGYLLR